MNDNLYQAAKMYQEARNNKDAELMKGANLILHEELIMFGYEWVAAKHFCDSPTWQSCATRMDDCVVIRYLIKASQNRDNKTREWLEIVLRMEDAQAKFVIGSIRDVAP